MLISKFNSTISLDVQLDVEEKDKTQDDNN